MPSGHTPLNGSIGSNISDAGKYKIFTRAKYCEGFINGTLKYESYFPPKELATIKSKFAERFEKEFQYYGYKY